MCRNTIEQEFLSKALSLCQDTAFTVRNCMAQQLGIIASAIGAEKAKKSLIKELIQLVNDETKEVKCVAFETLVSIMDLFDSTFRKQDLLPVFVDLMKKPPIALTRPLVQYFGEYFWKLSSMFNF